jgi:K+-sensing histidine kinase KdpD
MLSIRHTSPLLRYGVAVLAVGVAFAIKLFLDPLIVQETPFLLIFGAIMISAWYGGLRPGLLATVAAGLATDHFFLQPTPAPSPGLAWRPCRFSRSSWKGHSSAS